MFKYFLMVTLFLGSFNANSAVVFALGYIDDIPVESNYPLGHSDDNMTTISLYGVNIGKNTNRYMKTGLFLQYGMSSHKFEKKLYNYKEQSLINVGMTRPMTDDWFVNIGGGVYLRNTTLENGSEREDERLVNLHLGVNKLFYDKLSVGVSYDSGVKRAGVNLGFKF